MQPTDALEWLLVTQEVEKFLAADCLPTNDDEERRHANTLPIRCQLESPLAGVPFIAPFLQLHEAVLAAYWHEQVKMGDLPLDVFRMLQALEWDDPTASEATPPNDKDTCCIPWEDITNTECHVKQLQRRDVKSLQAWPYSSLLNIWSWVWMTHWHSWGVLSKSNALHIKALGNGAMNLKDLDCKWKHCWVAICLSHGPVHPILSEAVRRYNRKSGRITWLPATATYNLGETL